MLAGVLTATAAWALPVLIAAPPADPGSTAAIPEAPAPLTVEGRRVVVLGNPGALTDRVAAHIGPAIRAVEDFWGPDWPAEITVEIASDDTEFSARTGLGPEMAGAAVAGWVDPRHRIAAGQALVLAPGVADIGEQAFAVVLTHELFHYATRAVTALDAPRWLQEGVADYVARPAPASTPAPDRLPEDADFTATGAELSAGYDRAWLFSRFVAGHFGPQRLRALYEAGAGPERTDTDSALRRTLGLTPAELLAAWRADPSG